MATNPDWEQIVAEIKRMAKSAYRIELTAEKKTSRIGGRPDLPHRISWPRRDGRALAFLAQINLPDLVDRRDLEWLPANGRLLVFYDMEELPCGMDFHDKDGWSIIYLDEAQVRESTLAPWPSDIDADSQLEKFGLRFHPFLSAPSHHRFDLGQDNWDTETTEKLEVLLANKFGDAPKHQLGGFPVPIQGDSMEEECQLVSNGFGPSEWDSPFADELREGTNRWRLLLQIDSDDDLGIQWEDEGRLYFLVPEESARNRKFEDCRLILQYH